jgi:hypothetical protein
VVIHSNVIELDIKISKAPIEFVCAFGLGRSLACFTSLFLMIFTNTLYLCTVTQQSQLRSELISNGLQPLNLTNGI